MMIIIPRVEYDYKLCLNQVKNREMHHALVIWDTLSIDSIAHTDFITNDLSKKALLGNKTNVDLISSVCTEFLSDLKTMRVI